MSRVSLDPNAVDAVVLATRAWLERAVIGLGLCPFARAAHVKDKIRYFVSAAEDADSLLADLRGELCALAEVDADVVETTLVIAPRVMTDFLDFNDFLGRGEALLKKLKLRGVLQIASFHPRYQFRDNLPEDVANCTNRSPYPTLHLLREDSISRAVAAFPDAAQEIVQRNIATLRALGAAGWQRTIAGEDTAEERFSPPSDES